MPSWRPNLLAISYLHVFGSSQTATGLQVGDVDGDVSSRVTTSAHHADAQALKGLLHMDKSFTQYVYSKALLMVDITLYQS